ncbi:MAG: methylamine utilization protein MauJ, partial [Acidobacteriota bacterium]
AFRYFRYSQASQNVFDAYRSMFLALEAALDHLDPKRQGDSEKDWLRRALGSAVRRGIDLSGFVASSSKDPVEGFIDAHYAAVRCPVFHAKAAAGHVLRPGSLRDHDTVLNQLLAMQKLVEHLMKSVFLAKLPQGGFYHAGFGHLLAELAPMMGLLVCVVDCPTIDQLNVKEDNLPDGEGLPLRFEGRTSGMTDEWTFSCEMKCAALGFDRIQSLRVFAAPNNHIFLGPIADKFNRTLIKTDLNLQGISKLVVKVRCVLRNIHAPRRGFSS